MRILAVEDDRDAAALLALFLRNLGHEVRVAYDGWSGIVEASDFLPDIILSDIELPRINGYELARTLRSQDAFKETLLIAVTCHSRPSDIETAFAAGFDCHFPKPYDFGRLKAVLRSHEPAYNCELFEPCSAPYPDPHSCSRSCDSAGASPAAQRTYSATHQ